MSQKKNPIQVLFLSLMLIVLPLGSWYFLNKGQTYYENAISELQDYGPMPDFQLQTQSEQELTKADVENKMAIVAFINPESTGTDQVMKNLALTHKQFDKRNDVVFLIHLLSEEVQTPEAMQAIAQQYQLTDEAQCYFLTASNSTIQNLVKQGYQIPDLNSKSAEQTKYSLQQGNKTKVENYPYLVLIDIGQHIRNYYDATSKESVGRMVEHIALKLPVEAEEDPELKREKEK